MRNRAKSPTSKNDPNNKVIIFNENEIKEFMNKVWEEMTVNYGIIEDLQDQLDVSVKSKSPTKSTKSRKSSMKKSRSIKKSNSKVRIKKKKLNSSKKKKIQRSKGRKKKIKLDSTNSSNEITLEQKRKKKLKKMKMNTLNRRSATTDNIKKPSFSTKPKQKSSKSKGRLDELISKDRAKKRTPESSTLSFKNENVMINEEANTLKRRNLSKTRSKKAIKNFREGLNFNNFAEKTNVYFKDKLVNHSDVHDDYENNLVTIEPQFWRKKLSEVFMELRGENIY
jgi:hypothetical protein